MMYKTKKLTTLGILTALSIILMLLIRFPIFPSAAYLEYEPMDVPILIAGFAYGPLAGIVVTILSCLIQGITVSSAVGGWVGILMHFIASGTLVITASIIYQLRRSIGGAVIGLIFGTIAMGLIMIPTNLIITTNFYGMPFEAVKAMILPIILPFNLIKAGANSIVTFLIYKPLRQILIR